MTNPLQIAHLQIVHELEQVIVRKTVFLIELNIEQYCTLHALYNTIMIVGIRSIAVLSFKYLNYFIAVLQGRVFVPRKYVVLRLMQMNNLIC